MRCKNDSTFSCESLICKISVFPSAKYDQIKICDKEKFQEFTEIVTSHSGDETLMRAMTTF